MNKALWRLAPLSAAIIIAFHTQATEKELDTDIEVIEVVGQQESYVNRAVSSATKSLLNPLDIPLTVNVINDVFLRDLRAETLADAYGYTTGLSTSGINANGFTLRGLPANLQSVQVNGLPGLASRFGSPTTANVERIEILKGPASVLYGQLEPGGLVNIITKKPQEEQSLTVDWSVQTYETDVSGFGDDPGTTATLDATGALTADGQWLYRFIVSGESINSFRDHVDYNNYYIFPTLTYRASEQTELTFGLELLHENGKADDGLVAINNDINTVLPINVRYQEQNDSDNDEAVVAFATLNTSLTDDFDLFANWRSVWHEDSRVLFENNRVNDADILSESTLRRRDRNQLNKREYHFFDINTRGSLELAGIEHEFLIGVNSGYEKRDFERIRFGAAVTPNINILNPVLGQAVPSEVRSGTDCITELWNYGLYLQDVIYLTEQLIVLAGLRYDKQDVDFIEQTRDREDDQSTDAWVPMAGVVYKLNDQTSVYASYGESFDPNSVERSDVNDNAFDPEQGQQVELGVKASFFDERAKLSVAYFDIEKDNIVERNDNREFELLGELASEGYELEVIALPIENWQFKAGYAYVDAEVVASPNANVIGNTMSFAPKHDAYLWTRYNFTEEFYGGVVGLSLGINYESERFTGTNSGSRVELPSYTKADIGAYFETEQYAVALNIENFTDKEYYDGGRNDTRIYPGEPRKITLSLTGYF